MDYHIPTLSQIFESYFLLLIFTHRRIFCRGAVLARVDVDDDMSDILVHVYTTGLTSKVVKHLSGSLHRHHTCTDQTSTS